MPRTVGSVCVTMEQTYHAGGDAILGSCTTTPWEPETRFESPFHLSKTTATVIWNATVGALLPKHDDRSCITFAVGCSKFHTGNMYGCAKDKAAVFQRVKDGCRLQWISWKAERLVIGWRISA